MGIVETCHMHKFYRHLFFWIIYFFPFETSATASCGYMLNEADSYGFSKRLEYTTRWLYLGFHLYHHSKNYMWFIIKKKNLQKRPNHKIFITLHLVALFVGPKQKNHQGDTIPPGPLPQRGPTRFLVPEVK